MFHHKHDMMSVDENDPFIKDDSDDLIDSAHVPNIAGEELDRQQKRKGGRKLIYATIEERKQRNRRAQAAFRERRTDYIRHMEDSIQTYEERLHVLQAAQRNATDECLMLRYKNSLLERIMFEKGIDVQAELRAKASSPNLSPAQFTPGLVPQIPSQSQYTPQQQLSVRPQLQHMLNRGHQARWSISSTISASKLDSSTSAGSSSVALSPSLLNTRQTPSSLSNSPVISGGPAIVGFASNHLYAPQGPVSPTVPDAKVPLHQAGMMRDMGLSSGAGSAVRLSSLTLLLNATPEYMSHRDQLAVSR